MIMKNPIPSYNNKLRTASAHMKFGLNNEVNYDGKTTVRCKKQHQESKPHNTSLHMAKPVNQGLPQISTFVEQPTPTPSKATAQPKGTSGGVIAVGENRRN
jgi:hypothetical protein